MARTSLSQSTGGNAILALVGFEGVDGTVHTAWGSGTILEAESGLQGQLEEEAGFGEGGFGEDGFGG